MSEPTEWNKPIHEGPSNGMAGWIITTDIVSNIQTSRLIILQYTNNGFSHEFRLLDGEEDVVYYIGFSRSPENRAPLDDWGKQEYGCTKIEYWRGDEWVELSVEVKEAVKKSELEISIEFMNKAIQMTDRAVNKMCATLPETRSIQTGSIMRVVDIDKSNVSIETYGYLRGFVEYKDKNIGEDIINIQDAQEDCADPDNLYSAIVKEQVQALHCITRLAYAGYVRFIVA